MITDILAELNLSFESDISKLPTPKNYLDIGCGLQVPLYGSPLGGEIDTLTKVSVAIAPSLVKLTKLSIALGTRITSLTDLIMQLQIGQVIVEVKEELKLDDELTGYLPLEGLAKECGLTTFTGYFPLVGKEPTDRLVDIINQYVSIWINNGVPGDTGLEKANYILSRKPLFITTGQEIKTLDGQKLLDDCGITWEDLYSLDFINQPEFKALLCIYFRTGIGNFNPFQYCTPADFTKFLTVLELETNLNASTNQEIITNENVETQATGGGDKPPLESEETITINLPEIPERSKKTGK